MAKLNTQYQALISTEDYNSQTLLVGIQNSVTMSSSQQKALLDSMVLYTKSIFTITWYFYFISNL